MKNKTDDSVDVALESYYVNVEILRMYLYGTYLKDYIHIIDKVFIYVCFMNRIT